MNQAFFVDVLETDLDLHPDHDILGCATNDIGRQPRPFLQVDGRDNEWEPRALCRVMANPIDRKRMDDPTAAHRFPTPIIRQTFGTSGAGIKEEPVSRTFLDH
jgi:hypothetical protein